MRQNIYQQKQQWKLLLMVIGMVIVVVSLWYTNSLVKKIAEDERKKAKLWADAIQKKASLVKYTEDLFNKIGEDEREKVEIWAKAEKRLLEEENSGDLTFLIDIISSNKNIPIILTDNEDMVISSINLDFEITPNKKLDPKVKEAFSKYPPIVATYGKKTLNYLYYKDSKLFAELQNVLNDFIRSFLSEVVENSTSTAVVVTDSTQRNVIAFGNIDSIQLKDVTFLKKVIHESEAENTPIEIELANHGKSYIFYRDSPLLNQLKYYPYLVFGVIGLFVLAAYILFSLARKSEQNQVWLGLAKETAHQLGTPLSSLIAWVEYLRLKGVDEEILTELNKDLVRLGTITQRFSNIGSVPKLEEVNVVQALANAIDYIRHRSSDNVKFIVKMPEQKEIFVPLNAHLFDWVIENLCKNAVDAMSGRGVLTVEFIDAPQMVIIDISDTGKGLPKSKFKTIFNPGYTSKQRGWGLGLSLSERIIENYHDGKIFVKNSALQKGTTFRIQLNKKSDRNQSG